MEFLDYQYDVKEFDQAAGTFEGYASTFRNIDLQRDIVEPGAFTRTLKESRGRIPVLMAHAGGRPVGIGTYAEQDSKGLKVAGEFTIESDDGRNAYATAKHWAAHGHKIGLSIGYYIPENGATYDEKRGIRHLTDIDLMEYSIAPTPANTRARMTSVKSGAELYGKRAIESILLEKGLSRRDALGCAGDIYDAILRDADFIAAKHHTDAPRDAAATVQRDAVTILPAYLARDFGLMLSEFRAATFGR